MPALLSSGLLQRYLSADESYRTMVSERTESKVHLSHRSLAMLANLENALQDHRELQSCIDSMRSMTSLDPLTQELINQLIALAEAAADLVSETAVTSALLKP